MTEKVKKFGLALLALALLLGNTDWGTGFILWLSPAGTPTWEIFLMVALIANVEAYIWYRLGRELVSLLSGFYLSAFALFHSRRMDWFPKRISHLVLSVLFPFYDWERTKVSMELLMRSILTSKSRMVKTFLTWLFLPGSRSVTAVIFGMNAWASRLGLLMAVNTLHVALGFGFWSLVFALFRQMRQFLGI